MASGGECVVNLGGSVGGGGGGSRAVDAKWCNVVKERVSDLGGYLRLQLSQNQWRILRVR